MSDFKIDVVDDKPKKGMWHTGPNACWIKVTHIPTGQSITVYSGEMSHWKTRDLALETMELVLACGSSELPHFIERASELNGTSHCNTNQMEKNHES